MDLNYSLIPFEARLTSKKNPKRPFLPDGAVWNPGVLSLLSEHAPPPGSKSIGFCCDAAPGSFRDSLWREESPVDWMPLSEFGLYVTSQALNSAVCCCVKGCPEAEGEYRIESSAVSFLIRGVLAEYPVNLRVGFCSYLGFGAYILNKNMKGA